MSQYGIKIKNISAAMLYEVNIGIRDYFTYTDAMLNNSLFSEYLKKNGLKIYKEETTRDVICLDFDFGSLSFDEDLKRIKSIFEKVDVETDIESYQRIEEIVQSIKSKEYLYDTKSRDELRDLMYNKGVKVTYQTKNKDGTIKNKKTINYKMLYRTSAKAKLGQVIFIKDSLYDNAYDWLTMGLGNKLPDENAKIVELSAYAPLTTSTIIGTMHIPVQDILILKDQESIFKTKANVVKATGEKESKHCIVSLEDYEIKNILWDGMALIDESCFHNVHPIYFNSFGGTPKLNAMALLRNHFFKTCGFKSKLQLFFKDYCSQNHFDYDTFQVQDMFGNYHYVKDIKMITTDNSIKWKKFMNIMGTSPNEAYKYWCNRIIQDGCHWGIVKTDHPSKLGRFQQLSYQMINTLPCTEDEISKIATDSIEYVETLKNNNETFNEFLKQNSNKVNHYEMLSALYEHNKNFADSKWFRYEKKEIIKNYLNRLRKGKIFVNGDNLTVCGNPYALLLHAVNQDWQSDPTLKREPNTIQCYTTRFNNDEYLAAFRNPHNSPNNVMYLHNIHSYEMARYFPFSENIMAVNCIETDVQDRANGEDFDSDFNLVTNNSTMVECAKRCYTNFPTIVNAIKESGVTYSNTKSEYARMDNKLAKSRIGIGYSSNLAQLAITYYWTETSKKNPDNFRLRELYDNFIILSVLAQVIIDGCKREYEIDAMSEINRISKMDCMNLKKTKCVEGKKISTKCDFPKFMKYTKEIKTTKDGKELPNEEIISARSKLNIRINNDLICPMNWLEDCLDHIHNNKNTATIDMDKFVLKIEGRSNTRQISKIQSLVEEYDTFVKKANIMSTNNDDYYDALIKKTEDVIERLGKIKISNLATINSLIRSAFDLKQHGNTKKYNTSKYKRKLLNLLFQMDKLKFLSNFESNC